MSFTHDPPSTPFLSWLLLSSCLETCGLLHGAQTSTQAQPGSSICLKKHAGWKWLEYAIEYPRTSTLLLSTLPASRATLLCSLDLLNTSTFCSPGDDFPWWIYEVRKIHGHTGHTDHTYLMGPCPSWYDLACFVSQTASILNSSSCFWRSMRFFFSNPQRTSFCRYCGLNPLLPAGRCGSFQLVKCLNGFKCT